MNVVKFPAATRLDLSVETVVSGLPVDDLKTCIVLGHRKDGSVFFASSIADGGEVMWLMEQVKYAMLTGGFPGTEEETK